MPFANNIPYANRDLNPNRIRINASSSSHYSSLLANKEDKLSILKYGELIDTKFNRRKTARCRIVQKYKNCKNSFEGCFESGNINKKPLKTTTDIKITEVQV